MEIIDHNNKDEYLFRFNKYVSGWDQLVGVKLHGQIPQIISISWVLGDLTSVVGDDIIPEELNASTYRKFPLGEVTNLINSYILLNNTKSISGSRELEDLDYSNILTMAKKFTSFYPIMKTKWQDERNALHYISRYLIEVNGMDKLNNDNKLDLHNRVANRVGITKHNSIKVLNRLKRAGWLTSGGISTTLIPTLKTVEILFNVVSEAQSIFDKFEEKTYEFIHNEQHSEIFDYWYDNIFIPCEPTKKGYLIDGEVYEHNPYVGSEKDYYVVEIEVDKDIYDFEEEAIAEFTDFIDLWINVKEIFDRTGLWQFDNKYVSTIDNDLSVGFLIDENTMKQIRDSNKYINDMILFNSESSIDEILTDLGLHDYYEKYLLEEGEHEENSLIVLPETLPTTYTEHEAPF